MKKVAIDTQTTLAEKTGFGFYVSNLVHELQNVHPQFDYSLIAPHATNAEFSMPKRFWWDQVQFAQAARRAGADLVHQPAFSAPIFTGKAKVVVTVHDIIARLYGEDIPFWSRQYFARWMPLSYARADHVIAVSEHTKKDLVAELQIPEEKITVIYEAAAEEFFEPVSAAEISRVRQAFKIHDPYFVYVGTINPRKNLPFLVRAFAEVVAHKPETQLVIAGKKGWYYEELFELVDELGLKERVIFTGYLPDEDKPALLQGALALVFPSLYEGFGLPPLEAMAGGTPVIVSSSSSIPEIVGTAGILARPTDHSAWVEGMQSILKHPTLAKRLSAEGKIQAKKFSWKKTAEQTAQIYAQILGVE